MTTDERREFETWRTSSDTYHGVLNPHALAMLANAWEACLRSERIAAAVEVAEVLLAYGDADGTEDFILRAHVALARYRKATGR